MRRRSTSDPIYLVLPASPLEALDVLGDDPERPVRREPDRSELSPWISFLTVASVVDSRLAVSRTSASARAQGFSSLLLSSVSPALVG
jgi:hypothetical protein